MLEGVARQLAAIAKEYGYINIYCFPDLDSSLAASILLEGLMRSGRVAASVRYTPLPPAELAEPSMLIGYPSVIVDELSARKPSAALLRGEQPKGLLRIPAAARPDSSMAGMAAAVLSEVMVVGELAVYSLVAAYWRMLDRGKRAEFIGLEAQLAKSLSMEGKVSGELTLRLFHWFDKPVVEALTITLNPFLPGLTCRMEEARKLLSSDPRLSEGLEEPVKAMSQEKVAILAEKLYKLLRDESRVARRPSELIGYAYYTGATGLTDLREAAYMLQALAEVKGLSFTLAAAPTPMQVAAAAKLAYTPMLQPTCDVIYSAHGSRSTPRQEGRLQYLPLKAGSAPIIGIVQQQLRLLGDLPEGAVAAVETDDGLQVLLEAVLDANGYAWLREALGKGCLEYVEDTPLARLNPGRCRL